MKSQKTGHGGPKEFYTVAQLAELLQLTEMTIYRMVNRGELPHYKIGRVKRFRSSDVEQFLESHRQTGKHTGRPQNSDHSSNKNAASPQVAPSAGVKNSRRRGRTR
jgi:putative molybdopterin biosynthesis protein